MTRRRATREEVAAALWPDLDATAADRNLRVTLSYLHSVLEPGRVSGTPPYFVRTDGGQLVLADLEMLTVDVDEFLRAIDRAAEERRHGSPAVELEHLLAATEHYRGTFLADLGPQEWLSTPATGSAPDSSRLRCGPASWRSPLVRSTGHVRSPTA